MGVWEVSRIGAHSCLQRRTLNHPGSPKSAILPLLAVIACHEVGFLNCNPMRRFSTGSVGKASRSSSNAARLGLAAEEPEEDEDMYEALATASEILVDGFVVPKVPMKLCSPPAQSCDPLLHEISFRLASNK